MFASTSPISPRTSRSLLASALGDSEDLLLNISRETLQHNKAIGTTVSPAKSVGDSEDLPMNISRETLQQYIVPLTDTVNSEDLPSNISRETLQRNKSGKGRSMPR